MKGKREGKEKGGKRKGKGKRKEKGVKREERRRGFRDGREEEDTMRYEMLF